MAFDNMGLKVVTIKPVGGLLGSRFEQTQPTVSVAEKKQLEVDRMAKEIADKHQEKVKAALKR